jgi:hypothetical protein
MHPVRNKAPLFIFSSMVLAASYYGYAFHRQGLESFKIIQIHGIELSTGKTLEENLVQSAFQQTLGEKCPFQYNNLKKQIYTSCFYQD